MLGVEGRNYGGGGEIYMRNFRFVPKYLGGYFDLSARGKRRGFSPGADMGPVGLDQSKGGILKKSEKFCPRIFSGKKKMFFSRLISRVMEWNGVEYTTTMHN